MKQKNLAVFISGEGTNLQVILNQKHRLNSLLVVSSNPNAFGLLRAKEADVETLVLDKKVNWEKLSQSLQNLQIDLIFCAGFMKIIPATFVDFWKGKIFNLHPSLLPEFKGLRAIERAYEERAAIGVSIHHVSPEVDAGDLVLQEVVLKKSDLDGLSLEQVIDKVHEEEHRLVGKWLESQL